MPLFAQTGVDPNRSMLIDGVWYERNINPDRDNIKTIYGFENGDYTSISNEAKFDTGNNEPEEYFNLQGMKVSNPEQGNIYIRRQGAKVEKVVL